MKKERFSSLIGRMDSIIRETNTTPHEWTFLTSISYMFSSRIYMQSVWEDICTVGKCLEKGSRILDIGTGVGYTAVLLSQAGYNAEGIDTLLNKSIPAEDSERFRSQPGEQKIVWSKFEKKFGNLRHGNLNFRHYGGKKLPYKSDSFDAVTAYAVIEHVADDEIDSVMGEIKRVLKPGGLLFVFKLPRKLSVAEHAGGIMGIGKHKKLFREDEASRFFAVRGFEARRFERQEMSFSFPSWLANRMYPFLDLMNRALINTPLGIFSHHMNLVLVNMKEAGK